MRELSFEFNVVREPAGVVCEPQITQVWYGSRLRIVVLCEANRAATLTSTKCFVDHRIHLGYAVRLPGEVFASNSLLRMTFDLDGLRKLRAYEVVLEAETVQDET